MALAGVSVRLSSAAVGCCCALAAVQTAAAHAMSPRIRICFMGPPGFASLPLPGEKRCQQRSRKLEAEHVAGFHEELAAVVEEAVAGVGDVSRQSWSAAHYVEILQVAVVSNINRCA